MLDDSDLPPLQSLVVFEASARLLSFTAAARELGTTQPAVSQQIRGLEESLGVTLFDRIYRGVVLTDAGYVLLKTTQSSLRDLRDVLQKIKQKPKTQRITVATDFAFAAFWLMPRLPEFRRLHKDIDIRIQTSQSEVDLVSLEADVAILFGGGQYQGYYSEKLLPEVVYPVCSPKLFSEFSGFNSLADLVSAPLLKLNADMGQQWVDWEQLFQLNDSLWQPSESVMEFDNYTLLVQAAISGQGVGLGWSPLLDDYIQNGVLVSLPHFTVESDNGYYIVLSKQHAPSAAVSDFLEWLRT
ncbi:MAG: choline sulfate utilization transcriptional regulator [Marinomonas foliarum]|jgi:putative choline sulfate-utilization transcription factor|uniref:LysR family transcriptional regulator n=1 Tax=Marinomonas foliarum TaxID=491950 RepID=A0A368ZZK9_9GAMM|nr:LysR substrate-binding domain-containing protein [Marinomonas foliarum]QRV23991.1 LysR family transcriptional regulator [Marinomonas foliarum]RCX02460.1 LysR family transcriptional regulator [Marinomonas foliarum]